MDNIDLIFRNLVSIVQNVLDPVGVESRKEGRLKRRVYRNKGPNFLIVLVSLY